MQILDELRQIVLRNTGPDGTATPLPRLRLLRADRPSVAAPAFYEPVFSIALQGAKRLIVGDTPIFYDPERFLLVAVDLPVMACIVDAKEDAPYLCVTLRLDRLSIVDMLANLPPAAASPDHGVGLMVGRLTDDLLDPVARLLRLIEKPQDAAILGPLAEREILYRLLTGPTGHVLRRMVAQDSRLARVGRSIEWIKRHFSEPMRIEGLAEIAGMSHASFHRHFKAVTSMSPLQYQKQIRLQEARRRLVAEELDAGIIGFAVGYESQSQFSREYARLFGAPPARDAQRLRAISLPDAARLAPAR